MANIITLVKSAPLEQRIDTLKLLYQKAEEKVIHADTFRQRNLNYALVIFAGLIAAGVKISSTVAPYIISITLIIVMVIFCGWDRRWHQIKHGWDHTGKECYLLIVELINNPIQDVSIPSYISAAESDAEWFSWQPIIFYFLILASIASFFVLKQIGIVAP
jgi:hypothetical protein